MDIDEYTTSAYREELVALAQTIQNLFIIEKGTYPNDPDLGIGINTYIFEFIDSQTLNEIRLEAERQIGKYIFHENINVDVIVEPFKLPIANTNTLKISVEIYATDIKKPTNYISSEDAKDEVIELGYLFTGNYNNNKVVSKLLI